MTAERSEYVVSTDMRNGKNGASGPLPNGLLPVRFRLFIAVCAAFVGGVGLVALLGWALELPVLASLGAGRIPVAPSTAGLFVLYAVALSLRARIPEGRVSHWTGLSINAAGALLAALLLVVALLGMRPETEHLGFYIVDRSGEPATGHMSPVTALCFLLSSLSYLLSLPSSDGRRRTGNIAWWLASCIIVTGFTLALAYLYGTPLLYDSGFIPPAALTSMAFMALGIALLGLAAPNAWPSGPHVESGTRASYTFLLVFAFLAAGIVIAGSLYSRNVGIRHRTGVERQISGVAEMKAGMLVHWRNERLADASLFHRNVNFSGLVRRYLRKPQDEETADRLRAWLEHVREGYQYDRIILLGADGREKMSVPEAQPRLSRQVVLRAAEVLRAKRVTFEDFYRDEYDGRVYLTVLVPVIDDQDKGGAAGTLALRIDPQQYFYPFLGRWPTPSETAETLLIRGEGHEAVVLNELRSRKNTALNLRASLDEKELPVSQAALGRQGVMEGRDHRGVPVIADVRAVPGSPWFLVSSMDISEVYGPLREALWMTIAIVVSLVIGAGVGVGLVWRQQRLTFYREQLEVTEALLASQELYHDLVDTAQDLIWQCDAVGRYVYLNPAWAEVFGYDIGEMLGKKFSDFQAPDNAERDMREFTRLLHGGIVKGHETVHVSKDGREIHLVFNAKPVYDTQGNIIGSRGTAYDITERKRAEKQLGESEEFIRIVLDNLPIGLAVNSVDPEVQFDYMNDNFARVYRTTREQLAEPDAFWEAVYEDPAVRAEMKHRVLEDCASGDPQRMSWTEVPIARRGTDTTFINAKNIPLPDKKLMISVVWDVTERKRAEEALRESEEKYRLIADNSDDWVYWIAPDRNVRYISPSCDRVTGYSVAEFADRPQLLMEIVHPEDREEVARHYAKVREDGGTDYLEYRIITKSGEVRWISHSCGPIYTQEGRYAGRRATNRNITERRKAEEEIKRLNAELEQRVRERTVQLEAANKELEGFSYSISHDLRAPLRHITGFAELLMKKTPAALDEKGRHYLNVISEAATQMGRLVDNLLSFSKMGRAEMLKEGVKLTEVVAEAVEMLKAEAGGRDIVWEIGHLPDVYGDRVMLKIVFENLLANAIKFTRLSSPARIEIGCDAEQPDETICFVKDNGVGFDMRHMDKLFGLFQRLHRPDEFEGTGLGLANVRRIIHRHGGRTWAEGATGAGATFYFSLPKIKEA